MHWLWSVVRSSSAILSWLSAHSLEWTKRRERQRRDHAALAMVAQSQHEVAKAEAEWSEALPLVETTSFLNCSLASCALGRTIRSSELGEATLIALRADPIQRSAATRALINAGLERHDDLEKLLGTHP